MVLGQICERCDLELHATNTVLNHRVRAHFHRARLASSGAHLPQQFLHVSAFGRRARGGDFAVADHVPHSSEQPAPKQFSIANMFDQEGRCRLPVGASDCRKFKVMRRIAEEGCRNISERLSCVDDLNVRRLRRESAFFADDCDCTFIDRSVHKLVAVHFLTRQRDEE